MNIRSLFRQLFGARPESQKPDSGDSMKDTAPLDYEEMIPLDAEDLAEQGMAWAYEKLLPRLRKYLAQPLPVEELIDPELGSYRIRYADQEHLVYAP